MKRLTILISLSSMLLGACGDPEGGGGAEIWMIYFGFAESDSDTTITHNFQGGLEPGTTATSSDWTFEDTARTETDGLVFAQVVTNASGGKTMLFGSTAYPGTEDAGVWTFAWTGSETTEDAESHVDGYRFGHDRTTTIVSSFTAEFTSGEITGSFSSRSETTQTWTESDTWDLLDTGFDFGQTLVSAYLVDASEDPILNLGSTTDCDASECTMTVTDTTSGTAPISGELTALHDDDAYGNVAGAFHGTGVF